MLGRVLETHTKNSKRIEIYLGIKKCKVTFDVRYTKYPVRVSLFKSANTNDGYVKMPFDRIAEITNTIGEHTIRLFLNYILITAIRCTILSKLTLQKKWMFLEWDLTLI